MARILFYSPFNQRSRDTESLMIAFRSQGNWVCSLSQQKGEVIHDFLRPHGIETYSFVVPGGPGWGRNWSHLKFLVWFCWSKKVDVIYSHLEPANFIASIAQFFIRARVILCRHHSDQYKKLSLDKDWSYRITYWLARHVIVYSDSTRDFMIHEEKVPSRRIIRINLAFDFSLYPSVHPERVQYLKLKYNADALLITVGSFFPLKRPELSIQVLKAVRDNGINAKLVLLGKGELEESLAKLAGELGVGECVFFPGHVNNVLEYLAASTFILHPSISEASCVSVKEAGVLERCVIVCEGVGDFDDYITNSENGFLVSRNNYVAEASTIVINMTTQPLKRLQMGEQLKNSVIKHFDTKNVLPFYEALNRT